MQVRLPDLCRVLLCQRGDQSSQGQPAEQGYLTFTGYAVRGGSDGERSCISSFLSRDKSRVVHYAFRSDDRGNRQASVTIVHSDYPCLLYGRKWLPGVEVEKKALRQRAYPPTGLGPLQSPSPETGTEPCVQTRHHISDEFESNNLTFMKSTNQTHTEQLKELCFWVWTDDTEEIKY